MERKCLVFGKCVIVFGELSITNSGKWQLQAMKDSIPVFSCIMLWERSPKAQIIEMLNVNLILVLFYEIFCFNFLISLFLFFFFSVWFLKFIYFQVVCNFILLFVLILTLISFSVCVWVCTRGSSNSSLSSSMSSRFAFFFSFFVFWLNYRNNLDSRKLNEIVIA